MTARADDKTDTGDGLPLPRRLIAIADISFGTALIVIDGSIANVALPTIANDLGTDRSASVLVVTVYQLVLVMTLLPFSALGGLIGLKRMYQYGLLLFMAASALCIFAKTLPFLLAMRVLQALGAGAALSVSSALVRSIYPARQLGRGLGVNTIVVASSAALAPTLGGLILAVAPWPFVFVSAAPLALLSLGLARAFPLVPPVKGNFDRLGAVLCALMFGFVIGGLESGIQGGMPMISALILIMGMIIGAYFVRREIRIQKPILPVDLLANPTLSLSAFGGLCAFIAIMTLMVSLPFRLETAYGFTPTEVGAVIAPWPLVVMFVAPTAAMLSDRYPAGLLGGIGMTIAVIGLTLVGALPDDPNHFDIGWRMGLCGAGFGLFLAPNARHIIGSAPRERAASAGGLVATVRLSGQTLGASLAAALLVGSIGSGAGAAYIAAGIAAIAGICSVARLNPALQKPLSNEDPVGTP